MELKIQCQIPTGHRTLTVDLQSTAKVVALTGPTGAGKTSLLRVLTGSITPPVSSLTFRGRDWVTPRHRTPAWQRSVAWVPQDAILWPHMRVKDNLTSGGRHNVDDAKKLASLLQIDHLWQRWPKNLSGGEKQRVALGRALTARADLLLLDEPFAALDEASRKIAQETTVEWSKTLGMTVVISSHEDQDWQGWAEERWQIINDIIQVSPL